MHALLAYLLFILEFWSTGNKLREKEVDVLFEDVGESAGFINTAGDWLRLYQT